MRPVQGISSLSLLSCFTAGAYRSGVKYTVCNDLIALLRGTVQLRALHSEVNLVTYTG